MRGGGRMRGLDDLAISACGGRGKGGPAPLGLRPYPPEFSDQKNEGSAGLGVS